jgi:hypothetical protein
MPNLAPLLSQIDVKLDQLLLDPNNPRFAELGQELDSVPEERFAEAKVQQVTYEKMKSNKFEVAELRDTIKNLGFLPMDRLVVRKWNGGDSFVVVEGNRRVTALRWLMELHEAGKEQLDEDQKINLTQLKVLLLDDDNAPDDVKWILPGLRHVSGIKEWGAYQKARAVYELRSGGKSARETAQSLGLATKTANQLWRSYLALNQMKADEEYEDYAEPHMYSYFEEVFKRPNVRDWLNWSDEEERFLNDTGVREFYGWMVGEVGDDGELGDPKLPEAKSVRGLGEILDDQAAMSVFRSAGGTLGRAIARYQADHPQEWIPAVSNAQSVLTSLTADNIRALTADDLTALNGLKQRVERVLEDHRILVADNA